MIRSLRALKRKRPRLYSQEPLERRVLLASVPVTMDISELVQLRNPDDSNPVGGDGDYYAQVKIGDQTEISTEHTTGPIESSHFHPHWPFTRFIDPAAGVVPIHIEMFDSDPGDDQVVDINPRDGETSVTILFNPADGSWMEEGGAFSSPTNSTEGS